jgi:hypothetical protein
MNPSESEAPMSFRKFSVCFFLVLAVAFSQAAAQPKITSPKEEFGFEIGADYQLIGYARMLEYWKKLERESDRVKLFEIGKTAEGRTMVMAVVTSPENHAKLDRYKEISKRLALAEGLTDDEARELAREGRAVVWIDGGLHATESLGSQQLIELVWQLAGRDDRETLRLLDDVILLAVPANPDGQDLIADWYMREPDPEKRSQSGLPVLYQKYIGHDNNRDFVMVTQPESEAMSRILYIEWHPQIMYNHHQTGPAGTVLFISPFRGPYNYVFDPLVMMGVELVGATVHNRFVAEDKPGTSMRNIASYSTWWNGGLRTTAYFHNVIGILSETIGNPTPVEIPFLPERLLPSLDLPYPILPQKWPFRNSVEYSITANKAILDVASKHREDFLYKRYLMGKNAIQKGSRDTWTIMPGDIKRFQADMEAAKVRPDRREGYPQEHLKKLFPPEKRDPRGYIIPADQPDFPTAVKFVNTLMKSGVKVHRAEKPFDLAGKAYPAGSFAVTAAQAFRPHVLSLFEPQDHPDDIPYPGGPPRPPYDSAGWTLAYQMGIEFDRILDPFDGPFNELPGLVDPLPGRVGPSASEAAGFILDPRVNDAFIAANRVLAAGGKVFRLKDGPASGKAAGIPGAMYVPASGAVRPILEKAAEELGIHIEAVKSPPQGDAFHVKPARIGLWDVYGGSMPSGWVRWILERFEFPFELVFAGDLDAGNLRKRFDILVFVGGAIPAFPPREMDEAMSRWFRQPDPKSIPEIWRSRLGQVTVEKTLPQIREFLEQGGAVATIGSSTGLAYHLGLPVANHLIEKDPDGTERPLPSSKYYVPGSVLQVRVDTAHPLAYGLSETTDVYFNNSPVFALAPDAWLAGVRPVAWFGNTNPLRSGWVWGDTFLHRGVQVIEAEVGRGRLFLFGPEITFRAMPHGTFKFLFNAIHYATAETVALPSR